MSRPLWVCTVVSGDASASAKTPRVGKHATRLSLGRRRGAARGWVSKRVWQASAEQATRSFSRRAPTPFVTRINLTNGVRLFHKRTRDGARQVLCAPSETSPRPVRFTPTVGNSPNVRASLINDDQTPHGIPDPLINSDFEYVARHD